MSEPETEVGAMPKLKANKQESVTDDTATPKLSSSKATKDDYPEETEENCSGSNEEPSVDLVDPEQQKTVKNASAESSATKLEEKKDETDIEETKESGELFEDNATTADPIEIVKDPEPPKKQRNSLIDRVKTVTEDGDTDEEYEMKKKEIEHEDDPWMIPDSNLRDPKRRICVVTTAALPWRTGTAVNPLLRALYLTRGRPKHHVTLVIPWCEDENDRKKTLGKEHSFSCQEEQEAWIRDFCRKRANCAEEEKKLKMMFYPSKYNEGFGSIFPSVDICSLFAAEEADIAILEEPEHLNWLRIPEAYREENQEEGSSDARPKTASNVNQKRRPATAKEKAELGWRFKFRHVVGIVHTNYKAYAEQYGVGAKFITAPALCALNALVVRAYCHRVILLSGTLPSLTPYKEVTCNVHGVRGEFLERPAKTCEKENLENREKNAPVYFIGKLIWAKGFDKILDLQNLYREKHDAYFPMDVYGAGGDAKAIKRAFFGRIPQIQKGDSSDDEKASIQDSETAEVFTWKTSLRSHLVEETPFKDGERHQSLDDQLAKRRSTIRDPDEGEAIECQQPPDIKKRGFMLQDFAEKVVPISVLGNLSMSAVDTTRETAGAAMAMMKNLVGAGLNVAFTNDVGSPQRTSKATSESTNAPQKGRNRKLIFDPPQSVFEFRRNPIPARFLGTKDHVEIRDISEQKVFLNMSTTEVLCTTSAEALAMGKFVILPKHPSNSFFLQFPNCMAYTSLEDCISKLEWALANEPQPLDEETALKLSWEGANERLFDSSAITSDEWDEWQETGKLKGDDDAARFHVETGMKGQLIGNFFVRDKKSKETN